jgi:hypothetical protein
MKKRKLRKKRKQMKTREARKRRRRFVEGRIEGRQTTRQEGIEFGKGEDWKIEDVG